MKSRSRVVFLFCALAAYSSAYSQQTGPTLTPQPMARDVMYRILFRQIAAFQTEASQLAAQGKPSAVLANYHHTALQLSQLQAAQLINVALPCVQTD